MTEGSVAERGLEGLLRDGWMGPRDLAQQLNVSVTTVSNRWHQLEGDGVLRGFVPIIDYGVFGYGVMSFSHLNVEGRELPSITNWLAEDDQLTNVYEVTTGHNIVTIMRFKVIDDMYDHIKRFFADPTLYERHTSWASTSYVTTFSSPCQWRTNRSLTG